MMGGTVSSFAHETHPTSARSPIAFIENKGQWNMQAKYKAEIPGGAMFLTDQGFVYNFVSTSDLDRLHDAACDAKSPIDQSNEKIKHHAYKVNFVGANTGNIKYETAEKQSTYTNYYLGNDASKWATNVGQYNVVTQKNVYQGVDLKLYTNNSGKGVKYDFVVSAGANPTDIQLSFDGVTPSLTKSGALFIKTSVNEITEDAPYTYQVINGKKVTVESKYVLNKGVVTFSFPKGYNKDYDLVIDPNLVFATYSNGVSSAFYAYSTTFDKAGNMYAGALAYGVGWPTTTGAFQTTYNASYRVAINKYSTDGTQLIYSTYFGGTTSGVTIPNALRVNNNNELVMAGPTNSTNLPLTTGAYQSTFAGGTTDIFVSKFNATGTALIGSTYVGGSGIDNAIIDVTSTTASTQTSLSGSNTVSPLEINFDAQGNTWIATNTTSTNFPTTPGAHRTTLAGNYDGVVFALNANYSQLIRSTLLGGNAIDAIHGVEIADNGNIVVCGSTRSTDFPVTSGAYKSSNSGGWDGFVTILNSSLSQVLRSTYLGSTGDDNATNIQLDCANNVYVMGRTAINSPYPTSAGVYKVNGGDVLIEKLNANLTNSLASTRLGVNTGTRYVPTSFLLDDCGNIYVGGLTPSSLNANMPVTPNAVMSTPCCFHFTVLGNNFQELVYGSYYGTATSGDHPHAGRSRFDPAGIVYQSFCVTSPAMVTYPNNVYGAIKANGTTNDIASFKFNFDAVSITSDIVSYGGGMDTLPHVIRGCKSAIIDVYRHNKLDERQVVQLLIAGNAVNGTDYLYLPDSLVFEANESVKHIEVKPLLVPNPTGIRFVNIKVLNPCGCEDGSLNVVNEATVKIYDSLYVKIPQPTMTVCPNTQVTITGEIDTTLNYAWTPSAYNQGSLTINPTVFSTTTFGLTVSQPGAPVTCPPNTYNYTVRVEPTPQVSFSQNDITICLGQDSLDINGYVEPTTQNYTYQWTPSNYLRNNWQLNNKFYAPVGSYTLKLTAKTPIAKCEGSGNLRITVVPPFTLNSLSPVNGTTVKYGDEVTFNAGGGKYYTWYPTDLFLDPFLQSPTSVVKRDTTYRVIGVDQYGCKDTADIRINVIYPEEPILPNAFTPNGDGKNDVFRLTNREYQKVIAFKIYNRWGQEIYSTIDPLKGWDGTKDGVLMPSGTYIYVIEYEMPNGERRKLNGDITLVR